MMRPLPTALGLAYGKMMCTLISGATTSTYTPVSGDIGLHLLAVASYMDRTEDEDNVDDREQRCRRPK